MDRQHVGHMKAYKHKELPLSVLFLMVLVTSVPSAVLSFSPADPGDIYLDLPVDDFTDDSTVSSTSRSTSTTFKYEPPDPGLQTSDLIIIGVSCAVSGTLIIFATVYGCYRRNQLLEKQNAKIRKVEFELDNIAIQKDSTGEDTNTDPDKHMQPNGVVKNVPESHMTSDSHVTKDSHVTSGDSEISGSHKIIDQMSDIEGQNNCQEDVFTSL